MKPYAQHAVARDAYSAIKEMAEGLLMKAARDAAELHASRGSWKLTARRMAFDYGRVGLAVEGMRDAVVHGTERGELAPPYSTELLQVLATLQTSIRLLLSDARRAEDNGSDLSGYPEGDKEGLDVLLRLIGQEIEGDGIVRERLAEVLEDAFPALYRPEEFLGMRAFYEERSGVLDHLHSELLRLSGGKGISKQSKAKWSMLKRNDAWIRKRIERALSWYGVTALHDRKK